MADAYVVDLTAKTITKNGAAVAYMTLDVHMHFANEMAPIEVMGAGTDFGFSIIARIHDAAADARVLAQGPPGLLGANVAAFAGKPAEYKLRSKPGDTLTYINVPGTPLTALALEVQSADGYQPS